MCVIFAEVFVVAVVVAPLASFQVHLQCPLPPLLAHFLTLEELADPVKQEQNFNVKPVFMNHIVKFFFVCVSCQAAMKNGKQSATVFGIDGISHCVLKPLVESMWLLMLQMKEVNITTTKASIVQGYS